MDSIRGSGPTKEEKAVYEKGQVLPVWGVGVPCTELGLGWECPWDQWCKLCKYFCGPRGQTLTPLLGSGQAHLPEKAFTLPPPSQVLWPGWVIQGCLMKKTCVIVICMKRRGSGGRGWVCGILSKDVSYSFVFLEIPSREHCTHLVLICLVKSSDRITEWKAWRTLFPTFLPCSPQSDNNNNRNPFLVHSILGACNFFNGR